ncbi:MAG: DUF302 domain-containing protein [Gammaproteobacteria bacterium]|nr:DUF302 domain-containing protein [Gammaproteobacteria bacterium]
MSFGFGKEIELSFDDAIDKVTDVLKDEGFGVLSDIDVSAKMKEKLNEDMPRYRILGACNPALAFQAISAVEDIGLLLPCNVLVREDAAGKVHVDFMDPASVLSLVDHPGIEPLAAKVKAKLERACDAL